MHPHSVHVAIDRQHHGSIFFFSIDELGAEHKRGPPRVVYLSGRTTTKHGEDCTKSYLQLPDPIFLTRLAGVDG